uniref:Pentatricopeptide repeat-containing protein n=1 Tax=Arundo donax TaxID=35708 RepID=A0A0A9GP68_ARUDO
MVDLFCRAGMFEKVEEMIQMMPMEPDAAMLKALLGACRTHKNLELGKMQAIGLLMLPQMIMQGMCCYPTYMH